MTDYYSLQKIAEAHNAEAVKTAARDRLASQAEAVRRKNRRAGGRSVAARLRALALASARRLDTAARTSQS